MHNVHMELTHTQDGDELVGVGRAASLAFCSPDSIRRYSDSGKLPTRRTPGNQRRFRIADVLALNTPAVPTSPEAVGAAGVSFVPQS